MNIKLYLFIIALMTFDGCTEGPRGAMGPAGITGDPGLNGTKVEMVQFCPGYLLTYPSIFPEYGQCIDGNLYAILDRADGYDYLTLLPPGDYNSAATGSPCNFVILSGCNIQQE